VPKHAVVKTVIHDCFTVTVDFALDTLAQPRIGFVDVALVHTVVCGDIDLQELAVLDLVVE
jgi:hypothetical protein